ncbi:MAG TPA: tetratricopeptide repeat protein [Candidatus Bathyarchaeia archaeon]|nr:tetratricopeptide repeat protein [Candidatus Bathyarchaeia archaeon]
MAKPCRLARFHMRFRPALIVAVALAVLWLSAYWRLHQLDWQLITVSRPGALALYLTGRYQTAARAYRIGHQGGTGAGYSDDPSGYRALRAGQRDEAERRARLTLALVPTAIAPHVTLGELALDKGRATEAAQTLAAVLTRQPDHVDARYLEAVALARAGDPGAAVQGLIRALRTGATGERDTILYRIMELSGELGARPGSKQPFCLLAHLHRYLAFFDERQTLASMAYAERAVATGDRPADAYLALGLGHERRGEHEAARRAMRHAVAVDPRHAEAMRWLAAEAGKIGDLPTQYRMITRAFEAAPTDPFYLADLERVLVTNLGDPLGMAALMDRALALDAGNAEAQAHLARVSALLDDQPGLRRPTPSGAPGPARRGEPR